MAIFQVTVNAGNNPARTYTVDAADEAAARKEAIRQAFSQSNARYLRMSQMKIGNIVEQPEEGMSDQEIKAEKDLAAKMKGVADKGYDELAKVGEEAVQTAEMPSFSAYADTLGENPSAGFEANQGSQVVSNFSQDDPTAPPFSIEDVLLNKKQNTITSSDVGDQYLGMEKYGNQGFETGAIDKQTLANRRQQLEGSTPFGAFLEELSNAGLGGIKGVAGRFLDDQYQPLQQEYMLESLMPLIMGEQGGEGTQRGAYLDALLRSETEGAYDEFEADARPVMRTEDAELIKENSPSFGGFLSSRLSGGGAKDSQMRQLGQLRKLSRMDADQPTNPFASGVLNPGDSGEASTLYNLAAQALQGRYSPIASQAIGRYIGSSDRAFGDFTRGNLAPVGDPQADRKVTNFADFLGKRFGLF